MPIFTGLSKPKTNRCFNAKIQDTDLSPLLLSKKVRKFIIVVVAKSYLNIFCNIIRVLMSAVAAENFSSLRLIVSEIWMLDCNPKISKREKKK